MKKEQYNIQCRIDGKVQTRTVAGYLFTIGDGLRFGVSNKTPGGETCAEWTVTELTTGYSFGACGKTRAAAIHSLVTGFSIDAIRSAVRQYTGPDVNPDAIPEDVIVSAVWRG